MTHDDFWDLYDSGKISVKVYSGVVDGVEKEIEAFEFGGKFFLRIHFVDDYVKTTRVRGVKKRYAMQSRSDFIKEFDNKGSANRYFKKASVGLTRIL